VTGKRERRCKQLLDDLKEKTGNERGSATLALKKVEELLQDRLYNE
jgi:hypothetical protein